MTLPKPISLIDRIRGVKLTFGIKLALIVALILVGAIWAITALTRLMVGVEFVRTAGVANAAFNSRATAGIGERLYHIRSEALMLLDIDEALKSQPTQLRQVRTIFFERNPDIAGVIVPGREELINRLFLQNHELPLDSLNLWLSQQSVALARAGAGEPVLLNASPSLGINLLVLFHPWQNAGVEEASVVFFSPQSISEITGSGPSTTMVVNGEGDILIHPDFNQTLEGANISGSALFEALWKAGGESVTLNFSEGGVRYIGAGNQVSIASAAVFSIRESDVVNEQIIAVTRRNIWLSVTILFLTLLVIWFFSKTVTAPVNNLIAATARIESGDFNLQLKSKSKDELGILTDHFGAMAQGLKTWVDVHDLVGHYNSLEITDKALAGKINMQGEYLNAVVLSANLVSFYDIFGKQEAPKALELLNFFIERMTEQVRRTGGVVDKLHGTRLIALWGVPFASRDLETEAMSAIHTVLSMRSELWELNTERESEGAPLLKMNCGINMGELLAGRFNCMAYHEYSVTGRTVELAMRCESINRPAKTDIMISKDVRDIAGGRILSEEYIMPKAADLEFRTYGLVNLTPSHEYEKQRWPYTLDDVKKSLQTARNLPKINNDE